MPAITFASSLTVAKHPQISTDLPAFMAGSVPLQTLASAPADSDELMSVDPQHPRVGMYGRAASKERGAVSLPSHLLGPKVHCDYTFSPVDIHDPVVTTDIASQKCDDRLTAWVSASSSTQPTAAISCPCVPVEFCKSDKEYPEFPPYSAWVKQHPRKQPAPPSAQPDQVVSDSSHTRSSTPGFRGWRHGHRFYSRAFGSS